MKVISGDCKNYKYPVGKLYQRKWKSCDKKK